MAAAIAAIRVTQLPLKDIPIHEKDVQCSACKNDMQLNAASIYYTEKYHFFITLLLV